jgi:hypothetical protein
MEDEQAAEEARRTLSGQVQELYCLVATINDLLKDWRLAEPVRELAFDAAGKAFAAYFAAEALRRELGRTE